MVTEKDFLRKGFIAAGASGKVDIVEKLTGPDKGELLARKIIPKPTRKFEYDNVKRELEIMKLILGKPFLTQLRYSYSTKTNLCIVMNLAYNGSLSKVIVDHNKNDTAMGKNTMMKYIAGAIRGVEELHKLGIIHRDLKTENILIDRRGHAIIADFGISTTQKETMSEIGTVGIMAPEINGQQSYDNSIDWWNIGVVIYEILTGYDYHEPIPWESREITNKISKNAENLLKGLLTRNPMERLGKITGATEIKQHPFFTEYNPDFWCKFEQTYLNEKEPPIRKNEIKSDWKDELEKIKKFERMSYTFFDYEGQQKRQISEELTEIITISDGEEEKTSIYTRVTRTIYTRLIKKMKTYSLLDD